MGEIITLYLFILAVLYIGSVLDKLYCIWRPNYIWGVKQKHWWEK